MVSKSVARRLVAQTIARVDTKKEYTVSEMTRDRLLPWHKDRRSYRKTIVLDATRGSNILRAKITGEGKGKDYKIKGRYIIKYLQQLGESMVLALGTIDNGKQNTRPQKRSGGDPGDGRKK